jgi:hypothetical protein
MQRAIERRLSHLEVLIPLPLNYARFVSRVREHARRYGLSPGSALAAVIENLNKSEVDRLIDELGGNPEVRSETQPPEVTSEDAIVAGFAAEDVELLARHLGEYV